MKLINADELVELMQKHRKFIIGDGLIEDHRRDEVDCCIEYVKRAPVIGRKKAKWEFVGLQMFVCSECKHGFRQDWLMDWRTNNSEPIFPNFCPNCGAEMRCGNAD